jgi:four helix bundle protein
MDKTEWMNRTKSMAIETLMIVNSLPPTKTNQKISDQVIRSCTAVGASYRTACRAKSKADLISRLKIVEKEADETMYFLEILAEINKEQVDELKKMHESYHELIGLIVSSQKTLRSKKSRS